MPAGLNLSGNFIRLTYLDDDVGGAYPTGTVLHESIQGRIEEEPANTMLLQQGLETKKIYRGMFWGHELTFREQDQFIVTSPPNHYHFGDTFRVMSRTTPNQHPAIKQNYILAQLERVQTAHGEDFQ